MAKEKDKEEPILAALDKTMARYENEIRDIEQQLQAAAESALFDWLLLEACKDYDTIDLSDAVIGKAQRKQWKALRDRKRNIEKMLAALQDLRQSAATPEGDKLRKKFEQEMEKYQ
jgi:hypothetical protein